MLVVKKLNDEYFVAKFGYSTEYFNRVREIDGSEYDSENKRFIIPMTSYTQFALRFFGEIVFQSPPSEFMGSPIPDYKDKYILKNKFNLPNLKLTPYNYQVYGFNFILNKLFEKGYALNCDRVGLGKTAQSLAVLMYMIENGYVKKAVIFCKKSLRKQWINEISKFTYYDLNDVLMIDGLKKKKLKTYNEFVNMEKGILVTNFDIISIKEEFDLLNKSKINMMVLDEAHVLSGYRTQKNKMMAKLNEKIPYKLFLTGTPMSSKPDDLYGVMQMLDKKYFGTKKEFDSRFIKFENTNFGIKPIGYQNLFNLEEIAHSIMISRSEKEVELDLPEVLPPNRLYVEMDNVQRKLYNTVLEERKQLMATSNSYKKKLKELELTKADSNKLIELKDKINKISDISQGLNSALQSIANDPRLLLMSKKASERYSEYIPKSYEMSPKTEILFEVIDNVITSNEKIIIFSEYKRTIYMLKDDIEKELNLKCSIYTGDMNTEQRNESVNNFVNNDDYKVFLSTSAGQEGWTYKFSPNSLNCGKLLIA